MQAKRKPGPKPRRLTPDDFDGVFLSIEQFSKCLGTGYRQTRTMLLENGIPLTKTGKGNTIHKEVARKVINGDWWLREEARTNGDLRTEA